MSRHACARCLRSIVILRAVVQCRRRRQRDACRCRPDRPAGRGARRARWRSSRSSSARRRGCCRKKWQRRTGARAAVADDLADAAADAVVVALCAQPDTPSPVGSGRRPGRCQTMRTAWRRPDGYRVVVDRGGPQTTIFVTGHDPRGTLYGVGEVLRALRWSPDPASTRTAGCASHARRCDRTGVCDPWASARLPRDGELVRRLGRGAVRAVHPRAGAVRRERDREHPLPGRRAPVRTSRCRATR